MTSWFNGFTKYFLKIELIENTELAKKQAKILRDKKPTDPLHLTIGVFHAIQETTYAPYFSSEEFLNELQLLCKWPDAMEICGSKYMMMGDRPQCFALCIGTYDLYAILVKELKDNLCLLVTHKFNLIEKQETFQVAEELYTYRVLYDGEVPVFKMATSYAMPIYHITLFTSFDLKRCNKLLFKKYEVSNDKLRLLSNECGESLLEIESIFLDTQVKCTTK